MKSILAGLLVVVSSLALVGCSSGGDAKLESEAPPPSANAPAANPKQDKNRPGAMGAAGGGGTAPADNGVAGPQ